MDNSKKLAKIMIVVAGIVILFRLISSLLPMAVFLCFERSAFSVPWSIYNITLFVLAIAITVVVVKLFFIKSDWLVEKIVKPKPDESQCSPMTTETAFRLVAFLAGSFVLLSSVAGFFMTLRTYLHYRNVALQGQVTNLSRLNLLSYVFLLIFAVYFIFGAPHLVRWHVRRAEQFKTDITNNQNLSDAPTKS